MKKGPSILTSARGFTLVEVIVAIFVVTVGIGGVFAFLQGTLFSGFTLENQLIAPYLAQEGAEIVRNIRDTNYVRISEGLGGSWTNGGLADCASGCEADYDDLSLVPIATSPQFLEIVTDAAGTRYQYGGGGAPTAFQRKITIDPSVAGKLDVKVEVLWEEKGNSKSFVIDTELYNWAGL